MVVCVSVFRRGGQRKKQTSLTSKFFGKFFEGQIQNGHKDLYINTLLYILVYATWISMIVIVAIDIFNYATNVEIRALSELITKMVVISAA